MTPRRAAKWAVAAVLIGLAAVGAWWYLPMLTTRAPHGYGVAIDTPGGPVLFRLTFWPDSRGKRWSSRVDQIHPGIRANGISNLDGFAIAQTVRYEPEGGLIEVRFHNGFSVLRLQGDPHGCMTGEWTAFRPDGPSTLVARAWRNGPPTPEGQADAGAPIDFAWVFALRDRDDGSPFSIELYLHPEDRTVVAQVHDGIRLHDLMHGIVGDDALRLSYFDGRDAYLFVARQDGRGDRVADLWNGDWSHRVLKPVP